jgi:hypothetical protein
LPYGALTISPLLITTTNTGKMSNTQVGNIYQQIIADVVESSRVDFEEGGVDEHVLEELRQVWSSLSIRHSALIRYLAFISLSLHFPTLDSSSDVFGLSHGFVDEMVVVGVDMRDSLLSHAACALALQFSRVGDPRYLALYPGLSLVAF